MALFFFINLHHYTGITKIIVVYGQIAENGHAIRKWPAQKMAITDKMVKNGRLSVKIQVFRTLFYGQMFQKAGFARKIRVKSWCISQNKKKSEPSLARISNHCSVVSFGSTPS